EACCKAASKRGRRKVRSDRDRAMKDCAGCSACNVSTKHRRKELVPWALRDDRNWPFGRRPWITSVLCSHTIDQWSGPYVAAPIRRRSLKLQRLGSILRIIGNQAEQ